MLRIVTFAVVFSMTSVVSAYAQQCLHGPGEAPDQAARRLKLEIDGQRGHVQIIENLLSKSRQVYDTLARETFEATRRRLVQKSRDDLNEAERELAQVTLRAARAVEVAKTVSRFVGNTDMIRRRFGFNQEQ